MISGVCCALLRVTRSAITVGNPSGMFGFDLRLIAVHIRKKYTLTSQYHCVKTH
jgi:hypothetical protein